ncbi:ROK family protein [Halobacillus andaensis]|uniref:ROK family protein n=1 Tax=Halobacillus andaensis TaxID=1176239 RepID=UPI003D71051D
MENTKTLGVDLGGTNLRVGVIDAKGQIVVEENRRTNIDKGPDYVIQQMVEMIRELEECHKIEWIGIGAPGPLDPFKGVILSPPNLPRWDNVPLVEKVKQSMDVPVYLDNDANAAALAEARYGAGRGYSSVFYITISTGIGGGYVLDGKIVKGAHSYAGEIGNMIVEPYGPKCSNLNAGSLESLASGTSIGRKGKARLGIKGGAEEVFLMARDGHKEAAAILDEAITYLAMGIANLTHIINPSVFVLGGGVMQSQNQLLAPLREKVDVYLYPQLRGKVELKPAKLGTKAGLVGAATLGKIQQ